MLKLWQVISPQIITVRRMGEEAVLVQLAFPSGVYSHAQLDRAIREDRLLLARALAVYLRTLRPEWSENLVTGYDSVLISYQPENETFAELAAWLTQIAAKPELVNALTTALDPNLSANSYTHTIPVVYGGKYGADLEELSRLKNLTTEEVIHIHSTGIYSVYLVGFAAGYAYMGAIAPEIDLPRIAKPRAKVPQGSVAVAAGMTGVYPVNMPGGWRLIGYTPLAVFDPHQNPPVRFLPGDKVQFYQINEAELDDFKDTAFDFSRKYD
jgi:inhibitor of KinA